MYVRSFTCLVSDMDGGAGGRAVSSSGDGVHCNGVVSARLQVGDCGCGLRSRDSELLGQTLTTCRRQNSFKKHKISLPHIKQLIAAQIKLLVSSFSPVSPWVIL